MEDVAGRWWNGIVRHEALLDRVEVGDLHPFAVVAAGVKLEAA
ncbi:hypothetical protein ACWD6N_33160 [Micromonospora sp. NPDC005163]